MAESVTEIQNKVEKGGNEQVTMNMLSQDVKTAMTGGSVAVVGKGSVNTTNLTTKAIIPSKTAFFNEPVNFYDDSRATDNAYVYFDGGVGTDLTTYKSTDYVPCISGDVFRIFYFLNGLNTGAFRYYCFYDSNYNVVSGQTTIDVTSVTIPNGASYVRFAINKVFIETNTLMITKNLSTISKFSPYKETIKSMYLPGNSLVSNLKIVDQKGGGDFTSINQAFDSITDDSAINPYTLIIMPGIYNEVVKRYGERHISIVGVNRKDCILQSASGLYADSPLMIAGDVHIANLSVISKHPNPSTLAGSGQTAYAVHTDSEGKRSRRSDIKIYAGNRRKSFNYR
jgi:hypothetical protein